MSYSFPSKKCIRFSNKIISFDRELVEYNLAAATKQQNYNRI